MFFWLQNKKDRGKFCNRGIQTVVHEHFQPRIKRHKHTQREKRSRGIRCRGLLWSRAGIRSIFGFPCACKLPVRHILQCRSRQVLSLRTVQKVLSLRTELNSNAATCKVCARFCCRLRWGMHTQKHQCTNPEESCGSDAGFAHGKRWLPSVPKMTRAHTTVIAHFNIDIHTHNKNEVACIQESIFTSISAYIYIFWKWANLIIHIWTRGLRKDCKQEL